MRSLARTAPLERSEQQVSPSSGGEAHPVPAVLFDQQDRKSRVHERSSFREYGIREFGMA